MPLNCYCNVTVLGFVIDVRILDGRGQEFCDYSIKSLHQKWYNGVKNCLKLCDVINLRPLYYFSEQISFKRTITETKKIIT